MIQVHEALAPKQTCEHFLFAIYFFHFNYKLKSDGYTANKTYINKPNIKATIMMVHADNGN